MTRTRGTLIAYVALVHLLCGGTSSAYEVVTVQGGATIKGKVLLKGKPPATPAAVFPKNLHPTDAQYCGKKQPVAVPLYRADAGGHLADVVVWLEEVQKGKAVAKEEPVLSNKDCRFVPLVQSMTVGGKLQVENRDPILHNTHPIYLATKVTAFNIGMPKQGQVVKKKIRQPGVIRVQCDAGHVWMRAWVHAFKHPYHTVTGKDGSFSLSDVPPGDYTLKAWHESAGTLSKAVKVAPSGSAEVSFTFAAK